jgi:predicted outer membrane repeat protein
VEIFIERSSSSINNKGKYCNLLIFGLFLIGIVIIFLYGMGNVSATSGNTIYVNGSSGNDAWDGQSPTLQFDKSIFHGPKKSIKNAIGTVIAGGTVNIANGNYSGIDNTQITIDKNVIINGQSEDRTIINGTNTNWIFFVPGGVNVTIKMLTLTNGNSADGGAITNDAVLTISDCNFTSNTATDYNGGAILDRGNGTVSVTGSDFAGNSAPNGGAISSSDLSWDDYPLLNINTSSFVGNTATNGNGGAIWIQIYDTLIVTSSTFKDNLATYYGGAIDNQNFMSVSNSNFDGNSAQNGGAISNFGNSPIGDVPITGCNFTGNNARIYGGAIYNTWWIDVHFNRIVGNIAEQGSAIYNSGGTLTDVTNNWWGQNYGPTGELYGVTANTWLILIIKASESVKANSNLIVTADLRYDDTGTLQTAGYVPNGIPINFDATMGTVGIKSSTVNGITQSIFKCGTVGKSALTANLDNQTAFTLVKIIDTTPPQVSSTSPKNGATGISKTTTIAVKFSENIKSSIYINNITVKNLTTGKTISIAKSITGNTLTIKTATKTANTWYTVTIPKAAIKDYAGNNLQANYTVKFKTGK